MNLAFYICIDVRETVEWRSNDAQLTPKERSFTFSHTFCSLEDRSAVVERSPVSRSLQSKRLVTTKWRLSNDWPTIAERVQRSAKVNQTFHEWELVCMFKTFFPDQRSTPISGDYWCSLAFTQGSSGAIPATIGDYQRFLKRHRTLTRTSWCDGPISNK
jgi:hypothetical protein